MKTLRTVTAERATELIRTGAVLVDIREADEQPTIMRTGRDGYDCARAIHGSEGTSGMTSG